MSAATRARSRPVRRRLPAEQRRLAILTSAAGAFAARGYAATSMEDLARAAGVSHLIVYRHFDSKERLYREILRRARAQLDTAIANDAAVGSHGPTPAAVLAAARADPEAFRVLWHHAAREPRFAAVAEQARTTLLAVTAAALTATVPAAHLRWATRATVSYLVESVLAWVEDGDPALDERFLAATEAALRAGVRSWSRRPSEA